MSFASQPPTTSDTSRNRAGANTPVLALQARAAALIAAAEEANARRLAEARVQAAAMVTQAEQANAEFLKLAEEQAALLLGSMPSHRHLAPVADAFEPTAASSPPTTDSARPEPKPVARIHPELGSGEQARGSIDGGVDLIVGPFARFSQLAAFTRSVRELPGVSSLDTREFLRGTVHLRLRYEDAIPLGMRLGELSEFRPSVVQATPSRIELRVNLADPQPEPMAHAA